jgi:hypothetical protein
MTHIRTQIREAFKTALVTGLPSAGYSVFSSRKYSWNADTKALVDMTFLNDQTQARETMDDSRVHVGSLYIRVQRQAASDALDDTLDADELRVVAIVEATNWLALLEEDPELIQVNFTDGSDSAGKPIGGIVLRYDLEYRINKSDPETAIP